MQWKQRITRGLITIAIVTECMSHESNQERNDCEMRSKSTNLIRTNLGWPFSIWSVS